MEALTALLPVCRRLAGHAIMADVHRVFGDQASSLIVRCEALRILAISGSDHSKGALDRANRDKSIFLRRLAASLRK